ncbi:hypothetical protein R3P38DRAFT_3336707 [Favolaschia claudopus]|uniref:Uncharacterized protein n=1 Tax=Favolaschia claudopus TaxID=2862362 RepID=A0AAV9Z4L1_9AGAR
MAANSSEAPSVAAVGSSYYRSAISSRCKATFVESDEVCDGEAILRCFRQRKINGKAHFFGCSNWSSDSSNLATPHRFIAIPREVRKSIVLKLYRNEPLDEQDDDTHVLPGQCKQIYHPSHAPNKKLCPRNHYRNGLHVIAELHKHECNAQLSLFIPVDPKHLRIVIIPLAGVPHCHPNFPPAAEQDLECRTVQELHPGMMNNRKRRDLVKNQRQAQFPHGTDIEGVLQEFYKDRALDINDRYIHAVNTQADDGHITINPYLAHLALEAMWIMVDTTFAVKRTAIARIWSNRATRDAFILVWKGIFEAIETITGKKLNFKAFSPTSNLLGAIGDSEGAQAQGLADVIILRQMNYDNPVMHFDDILKLFWKTCLVHFTRGVLGLRDHVTDEVMQYLLSFPYLETPEEVQQYYTSCADSTKPKIQGSHAQDNQIKPTSRPLLEAILLAKDLDAETAHLIEEMISSGVLQNSNSSLQARFKMKAQRQARALDKRRAADSELVTRKESRILKDRIKATEQENEDLRRQLATLTQASTEHPPYTPKRPLPVATSSRLCKVHPVPIEFHHHHVDALYNSDDEFDYAAALNSDVLSPMLKKIIRDHPMPGIDE